MVWFRNTYDCPDCEESWSGEWSCSCDDDCPSCGSRQISPSDVEDLTVIADTSEDIAITVRFSPPIAEHEPRYIDLVRTTSPEVADAVREAALIVQAFR